MAFNGLTLTTKGINLLTKVLAGATMTFTKIKIGDGTLASGSSLEALADLVDPKLVVPIESVASLGDGTWRVRGTLTNTGLASGFFVREVGLFATDPDVGEILYAVANAGSECDYLPAGGGSVAVEQVISLVVAVSNAANVTTIINEANVFISKATFNDHVDGTSAKHAASAISFTPVENLSSTDVQAVLAELAGKIGLRKKSTAYVVGDCKRSLTLPSYAYLECTVAGTTAAAEPTWPAVGSTVTDGSVTWVVRDIRCLALTGGSLTGVLNEALGMPIASAATLNLTSATGNTVHITGTTAITAVTLGAGMRRNVIFDGVLTLTHNATTNNLPGTANITTAAGDRAEYVSDGTTVYCTKYQKADGQAVVAPTIATQAEAQSGTDNTKMITPLQIKNALNASGNAPIGACRARVTFDGSTSPITIKDSMNVSSVTDLGVGTYQVNFTTALPTANPTIALCTCGTNPTNGQYAETGKLDKDALPTTTSVKIVFNTVTASSNGLCDAQYCSFAAFC